MLSYITTLKADGVLHKQIQITKAYQNIFWPTDINLFL